MVTGEHQCCPSQLQLYSNDHFSFWMHWRSGGGILSKSTKPPPVTAWGWSYVTVEWTNRSVQACFDHDRQASKCCPSQLQLYLNNHFRFWMHWMRWRGHFVKAVDGDAEIWLSSLSLLIYAICVQ